MSKLKRHRPKQVLDDQTLSRPDPPDRPIDKTSEPTKNHSSPAVSGKVLMDLYRCQQDQVESVRAFFARVNQIASRVPLSKLCDCGCNNLVPFASETVLYLVLCGLSNKNMQTACFLEAEKDGILNESSLIAFCDGLSKEKISDKSEDEKSIMDEDMDIDMRCLSLAETLPKEEDINSFQSEENTNIGSNHDIEAEAQYSRETGPVDLGFGSIFWEVAKDFSFVIREVIGDIDNKDPSAENNNQSGRPISPDP